ncbi:MAG: 1-deoxy-D-xylulose-5-phosphate reductoisomerase [Bacteroidetes bacterium]|nr:1-deoxy-D-xylulose-5-phosphate reductoisomerase [Bacteroidota bacterium]
MCVNPKNIAILGSTGSIGQSSIAVLKNLRDRFRITYLTTNVNIELLEYQIRQVHPYGVVVLNPSQAEKLKKRIEGVEVLVGTEGLLEVVRRDNVDIVLNALVGFAGLRPTIEAITHRKHIALANKETLVVAGAIVTTLAREYNVPIVPIDSEHSAILQCLTGEERSTVKKIILTASGGPFLNTPAEQFPSITVEEALKHPNWKMGNKITIDSATLMNKGLEVIEAHWLFNLEPQHIEVVIHPQSIIHSMVEFIDGSIKAQLGYPDMKIPIQYALTYPDRLPLEVCTVNFPQLQCLTFLAPDLVKFRCLQLAYDALTLGGTAPAVLNAANEVAVHAFLERKITFDRIPQLIEQSLAAQRNHRVPEFEQTLEADRTTREFVRNLLA